MKKIFILFGLLLSTFCFSQTNPTPVRNGQIFPNATELSSINRIPTFTSTNYLNNWISPLNLLRGVEFIPIPAYTTTERDALVIPSGDFLFIRNTTTNQYEGWNGIAWEALGQGGGGTFPLYNDDANDDEIDFYEWLSINGSLALRGTGGTNGNAAPIIAIDKNDLSVQLPLANNAVLDAASLDAITTKRWQLANLGFENIREVGNAVSGDLHLSFGDYNNFGNGTKIELDDEFSTLTLGAAGSLLTLQNTGVQFQSNGSIFRISGDATPSSILAMTGLQLNLGTAPTVGQSIRASTTSGDLEWYTPSTGSGGSSILESIDINASTYTILEVNVSDVKLHTINVAQTDVTITIPQMSLTDTNIIQIKRREGSTGTLTIQGASGVTFPTLVTDTEYSITLISYEDDVWEVSGLEVEGSGAVDSVNGETDVVVLTTDDISDTTLNRYITEPDLIRLSTTTGTNTGDQDLSNLVNLTGNDDDILLGNGGVTSLAAIDPNATPVPKGQIYVNNFDTLNGLTLEETTGTVTLETLIGTTLPNVTSALTINHVAVGDAYAAIDLGQTYDELYIQYYTTVANKSTATSYTYNTKIGSAINNNSIVEVYMNHAADGSYRAFGVPNFEHIGGRLMTQAVWVKIGLHIDRVAQTCDYYIDGRLSGQRATNNEDMRYITLGGNGDDVSGYVQQYASLTVNSLGFQDIITNSNGLGDYFIFYADSSLEDSGYDMTNWTGLHAAPFDPDGGTNYIDGPALYLSDIGDGNAWSKPYDVFRLKRGETYKMKDLATPHRISLPTGGYDASNFNKLETYGTGDLPILDVSVTANPASWTVHDAGNSIYKISVTGSSSCNGVWVNDIGLREAVAQATMQTISGTWFSDSSFVYVRLYDDSAPSLASIDLGSSSFFFMQDYSQIKDIHFRHGEIALDPYSILEQCEFSLGAGAGIKNWTFQDNKIHDIWSGKDYGATEASNPGSGVETSGLGVFSVYEDAKVIRNTFEDTYVGLLIYPDAHDALIVFNEFKNIIVNTINFGGNNNNGLANRPIKFYNNTIYASPRHVQNDPYPLTRDQPGHAFVTQLGGAPVVECLNNAFALHYNENITTTSVMNIMSIINAASAGKIDYNRYYITKSSTTPAVIFNLGNNDIDAWSTQVAAFSSFTGINDSFLPDENSEVVLLSPTVLSTFTDTSGKWLETIGLSRQLGGGYPIDFSQWGITHNLSNKKLEDEVYINIGAY